MPPNVRVIPRLFPAIAGEIEPVFHLGPLHALLEVFLPVMRPWPAVDIRHFVLDRLADRDRRLPALDGQQCRHAFEVLVVEPLLFRASETKTEAIALRIAGCDLVEGTHDT